ncbi:hypothetical protein LTR62_006083 [Meristemomyces frigidus]|uniref:Pru domain-containing protein n=1 Tax=Meristemomyces frigidus TaxID=1508187 RepID=A0AAN7TCL4_9PEZI|nr:hypothetical protein LTR62_006083 [Meristemomyces frigidus]
MSSTPLITFKAGKCTTSGRKVRPEPTPGYLYIYSEDDFLHLCWRPRSAPSTNPDLDLLMIPGDGTFHPVVKNAGADDVESPTNGRIFVLTFSSSSQKYYFWMQSAPQHKEGNASWFSSRDQRIGQVIDSLLQGEDIDVEEEEREIRRAGGGDGGADGDADAMEVDEENGLSRQGSGGAGQDATGGDPREEGSASRDAGADGGRAPSQNQNTNDLVQNFLNSINNPQPSSRQQPQQHQQADKPYTTLSDLLIPATTIPFITAATETQINHLCAYLPPEICLISQESASTPSSTSSPASTEAAIASLPLAQKQEILTRALRSPQFAQSLGSLTVALRDGGLPMIGEALGLKVKHGGTIKGGIMPLGGGEAVEGFVEGVKATVEEEMKKEEEEGKE